MEFKLTLEHSVNKDTKVLFYNSINSNLLDIDKKKIHIPDSFSMLDMGYMGYKRISISLGLKCNMSCNYCVQSKIPKENTDFIKIDKIISDLENRDLTNTMIEFWGGEPLLYLEEIKYIISNLKNKPMVFCITTNGTLLTIEIVKYLLENNVIFCFSHDAQAQNNRGKETLDNINVIDSINYILNNKPLTLDYFNTIKFNSVLTKGNYNSDLRKTYFASKLGRPKEDIILHGEGVVYNIKPELKIVDTDNLRHEIIKDIKNNGIENYKPYYRKVHRFFISIKNNYKLSDITTKCGIDRPSYEVISTNGKELTCHNFDKPFEIKMFHDNPGCSECIVAHLCRGGCPAIPKDSEIFKMNCKIKYEENLAILIASLEMLYNNYNLIKINDVHI